jgi:hypothetical protein
VVAGGGYEGRRWANPPFAVVVNVNLVIAGKPNDATGAGEDRVKAFRGNGGRYRYFLEGRSVVPDGVWLRFAVFLTAAHGAKDAGGPPRVGKGAVLRAAKNLFDIGGIVFANHGGRVFPYANVAGEVWVRRAGIGVASEGVNGITVGYIRDLNPRIRAG